MAIRLNDDGAPNLLTYLFTDLSGNRIADLPLSGVSWTMTMNQPGQFAGTLDVEDPRVTNLGWLAATAPNLAQVWVDIGGSLVWGGIVNKRTYRQASGLVEIQGSDHLSYLARRLQAVDYSTTWATTATGAVQIARQVVADALAVTGSLSLAVSTPAATPAQYGITLAAPLSQRMTVDSIVNQLSALGYLVGFDYAMDVAYVSGVPTATLTLSYPRRGRIAGSTGLVLDTTQAVGDLTWGEDGTQQAMSVAVMATGAGGVAAVSTWQPAISTDKYPLLERMASHTSFSTTATPAPVMAAYGANDLALSAYPIVTPQVTMPMFTEPVIGEWIVGDDVRVIIPKTAGSGAPVNPRFPGGMDFYWRITRASCVVPDAGIPTVQYGFGIPPSSTPQRPPL